ncbi:MAG: dTDP-glucose 4,6-dehydratase [Deltaproteobacteria bacterium HGW-Deltaproteobacteria-14]|nr:MAG: dTDP-glucose 4,6-dehydratase [Deltaproteobacteria bacterium HGW-Deltaproteobacteria-14]
MNLLVTGGAGFIGATFVRRRRAHRPDDAIVVLDALTYAGTRDNLAGVADVSFVHGDVCDAGLVTRVLAEHRIDHVVHLAAESHVDRSIVAPDAFVRTNVLGTAALLHAARAAQVRRFVHVSTDEVYGELADGAAPWREDAPLAPRSPYAASKAAADHLVSAFVATYGMAALITRCTNNYGPRQMPEKLIPRCTLAALHNRPLPLYGDGRQVRDWIHVDDHCDALERVLDGGLPGQIYHVAGDDDRDNLAVARAILAATGRPEALLTHVPDRPGHDRRYALDASKIARELGFTARRRFTAALPETVAWYADHAPWCEAALTRLGAA